MAYHRPLKRTDCEHQSAPEKYNEIFSEFDFLSVDDNCDFFCPGCRRIMECMAYEEVKDGWESFYM